MGLGVIKEFIMRFSDFAVAAEAAVLKQKERSTLPYMRLVQTSLCL